MKRILTTASALAITAVMAAGVAYANPLQQEAAATPTQLAQLPQGQAALPNGWHYEWQYTFDKWNQMHPGWVAIPSKAAE